MDPLFLSRLQFAAASMFHFLFVPLTLGLTLLIALMESRYVKTGDPMYQRMAKFWGKLFIINFALGVVTGITLEFQFGTNWARYSTYVGDIFGPLLAIEATAAFFLESTFVAVWLFGWDKLSPKAHARAAWLVFIGSNLSAVWILIANGFMQHPVGYVMRNGRAELDNFLTVVANTFAWQQLFHTLSASYLLGAMFIMGVSAWHLLRKQHEEFFTRSLKFALPVALIGALVVAGQGHFHGNEVAMVQPAKLAAMEAHWDTAKPAGMNLFVIPSEDGKNVLEIGNIPYVLSILAYSNPMAEVKGLNDFPKEERPPVAITFTAFRIMVGLGTLFIALLAFAWLKRADIEKRPMLLKALFLAMPLPWLAIEAGWAVAEVGRQPWIVYGMLKTSDAVSPAITTGQVGFTLFMIVLMYSLLGAAGFFLVRHYAAKGPQH